MRNKVLNSILILVLTMFGKNVFTQNSEYLTPKEIEGCFVKSNGSMTSGNGFVINSQELFDTYIGYALVNGQEAPKIDFSKEVILVINEGNSDTENKIEIANIEKKNPSKSVTVNYTVSIGSKSTAITSTTKIFALNKADVGNVSFVKYDAPLNVGGPCEYKTYKGKMTINSIKIETLNANEHIAKVKFQFIGKDGIKRNSSLEVPLGKQKVLKFTNGKKVLVKSKYDGKRSVITVGTCSPEIYELINL